MAVSYRAAMRLDDDDDPDLYDPKYPGRKVFRDGKGVHVPVCLTDGQPPEWMRSLHRTDTAWHIARIRSRRAIAPWSRTPSGRRGAPMISVRR